MPDPTVPPTPPVPLDALLAREDLGLRRVAGPSDPGVVVRWAHTSEMADPYPYLLGGELLLSAGVHIPDGAGPGYFDAYVSRIVAAGGAALGFGLAPVHDTVPRALVAACDLQGLPLLEVPPRTTFSGVARAVWQLMAQARLAELRRVTEAHRGLASAAARPDPVPSVLHRLSRHLDGRAVLFGPEGTEIAAAGRALGEEADTALAKLAEVVRPAGPDEHRPDPIGGTGPGAVPGTAGPASPAGQARSRPSPASATDTVAEVRLAAYALGAGHGFVLGVAAPSRDSGDHTIASVAAVLLSLLTGEQQAVARPVPPRSYGCCWGAGRRRWRRARRRRGRGAGSRAAVPGRWAACPGRARTASAPGAPGPPRTSGMTPRGGRSACRAGPRRPAGW
ncbi:hypothetical protein SHIRM173S_12017 [Streptomyces hirsutus]